MTTVEEGTPVGAKAPVELGLDQDPLHVAIDGPAGSGKSTVAKAVAARLGLAHVDTGAMYRALTYTAQREALELDDGEVLAARLEAMSLIFERGGLVIDGTWVGPELRTPEVDAQVSRVSAHGEVRRAMQRRQRAASWDHRNGVVMEGRDIGTRVLPLARCKIYLDASVQERAHRRASQAGLPTDPESLRAVADDLHRRDDLDSTRTESPLRVSPDAFVVDTSSMDREQVIDHVCEIARSCCPEATLDREYPRYRHLRFRLFKALVRGMFHLGFRTRVHGRGHQFVAQPLIYACNHISWWDPPFLGALADRQISFLAKRELFSGVMGPFLRTFGTIPIVRGRFDTEAFAITAEVLNGGGSVAIFPEGTRKPVGRPGPMKRGLGILAIEDDVAYIPCYVRGTASPWSALHLRRCRLELWMGPVTQLRAVPALRERGLEEGQIQSRVGDLYLAQVQALAHQAESGSSG